MIVCNKLREFIVLLMVFLLLPGVSVEAKTRKGDKFYKEAQAAEAKREWDKALALYEKAIDEDPKEPNYQLGARRVRFQAGQAHVEKGMKLRKDDKFEEALVEFQKAFAVDPGSAVAIQEIKHTMEAIEEKKAHPGEKALTSAEQQRKQSMQMIESLLPVPELKPVTNQISQLKMNNQPPKVLYETVGKLAGINVLFDPQIQPGKNANLDLSNVTLQEALDYVALLTKTFWKPVSANAIFVTEDNVTKRRDYEDEVVKVFYLRNPTSVQEFQEIVTAVRSVTDVRKMFTFNAQNAILVRDTVDKVALVEKLLHDVDKSKAEVVVDVIVMDVASDKSRSIAAGIVSNGTTGLAIPIGFSPTNPIATTGTTATTTTGTTTTTATTPVTTTPTTTAGSTAIGLNQLAHLSTSDFSTTLPGALLQAVMSDSSTKVMYSPEVRASDGQKVTLKIGQKYPYATGSFQPGVGTVGVSPLVSTQFQFVDTGVNLEMTPHVHGNEEVTLHVSVDISNVASTLDLGGLSQPVISQKKNEADIRLRDGEVSLLGGLMSTQDTNTINGIPGLVNIPIIGKYLFGGESKDKQKEELLIALIPHIVRTPDITGIDLRGISAGTDAIVKLSYAPAKEEPPAGSTPAPATAPAAAAPGAPTSTSPAGPTSSSPASTTPAVPTPAGSAKLSFNPSAMLVKLSSPVVVALQIDNAADLTIVPVKIKWDSKILRLNQVVPSGLLGGNGNVNPPSLDIRNDSGEATIDISRTALTSGVSGSGALMQLTFTAVGKGETNVVVTDVNLRNSKQQPITVVAPLLAVSVQ
jgi:general secretion pathway protein D